MDPVNTALAIKLAHQFATLMRESGMRADAGCAALALAYGIWIEAQEQADVTHCTGMMEAGKPLAQKTYQRLRAWRLIETEMGN
jgi:hypothetical protein